MKGCERDEWEGSDWRGVRKGYRGWEMMKGCEKGLKRERVDGGV